MSYNAAVTAVAVFCLIIFTDKLWLAAATTTEAFFFFFGFSAGLLERSARASDMNQMDFLLFPSSPTSWTLDQDDGLKHEDGEMDFLFLCLFRISGVRRRRWCGQ